MPPEHEIETPPGVAAIGGEEAGRGHDLSYSGVTTSNERARRKRIIL
jgi:hypothetical protein